MGAWIGFALSGMSVGMMVGPFLGGIIYAKAGYHAVFIMLLAFIVLDFILVLIMIEKKAAARWEVASRLEPSYGTMSKQSCGVSPPGSTASDERYDGGRDVSRSSSACTNSDTLSESSDSESESAPLMDSERPSVFERLLHQVQQSFPTAYKLLSSPRLVAALYGAFINVSILSAFESILPIFMHTTFGWESSGTGVIFLALTIPSIASSTVGTLSDRVGTRKVVLAGFTLCTIGLALMTLVKHDSVGQIVLLCALLALTGDFIFF